MLWFFPWRLMIVINRYDIRIALKPAPLCSFILLLLLQVVTLFTLPLHKHPDIEPAWHHPKN